MFEVDLDYLKVTNTDTICSLGMQAHRTRPSVALRKPSK